LFLTIKVFSAQRTVKTVRLSFDVHCFDGVTTRRRCWTTLWWHSVRFDGWKNF